MDCSRDSRTHPLFRWENLSFLLLLVILGMSACMSNSQQRKTGTIVNAITIDAEQEKQAGAHVFGRMDTTYFPYLHEQNIEWVTLVPWGFQSDIDDPSVSHHGGDSLYIQQDNERWVKRVQRLQKAGFKVFLKPHVWLNDVEPGKWRSDIYPSNEENWMSWKNSYRDFILRFAKVAQESQAEMFCIGTEFTRLTIEKPVFWKGLIQEIRGIYSGSITYAANWYQEYEQISFWDQLDFIGIQAYFPLVDHNHPNPEEISKGWQPYLRKMQEVHRRYDRKIVFTEMGYKSTPDAASKPWEWLDYKDMKTVEHSDQVQTDCYQVFFDEIWSQNWFHGVHIWQYRFDAFSDNRFDKRDFSPQDKPAQHIIQKGFQKE